jgi:hypothetical protein
MEIISPDLKGIISGAFFADFRYDGDLGVAGRKQYHPETRAFHRYFYRTCASSAEKTVVYQGLFKLAARNPHQQVFR